MPHVILDGSDISLYYRSNFSKFNPSKATILLLHGAFFSSDLLSPQFQDERLAGASYASTSGEINRLMAVSISREVQHDWLRSIILRKDPQ